MFKNILNYFKYLPIQSLKEDRELEYFIKLLAVATFADGKVKNIEVIETSAIMEDFLKNHFDKKDILLNLEELDLLKEYLHKRYVGKLKKYRVNNQEFMFDRVYILNDEQGRSVLYKNYTQRIIESDGIVTKEEKELIREMEN